MALNIFNVVELGGQWVLFVNDNDLPVGFLLVEKGHDTENFDALDLAWGTDELTNLANVEWVVVTLSLGLRVDVLGVFPCLEMEVNIYIFIEHRCLPTWGKAP